MDIAAIAISIISIIFNIYLLKKGHSFSINDKYFSEIFDELLIKDIPLGYLNMIRDPFDPERIFILNKDILNAILDLKDKIIFFKFYDFKFYNRIDYLLTELDDSIHIFSGSKHNNYTKNKENMDICMNKLYNYINNYKLK